MLNFVQDCTISFKIVQSKVKHTKKTYIDNSYFFLIIDVKTLKLSLVIHPCTYRLIKDLTIY